MQAHAEKGTKTRNAKPKVSPNAYGTYLSHRLNESKAAAEPLASGDRQQFETRSGTTLPPSVQLHQDPQTAQRLNKVLHASAFALGKDIYLGKDTSAQDKHTLHHELAHVQQQQETGPMIQRFSDDIPHSLSSTVDFSALSEDELMDEGSRIEGYLAAQVTGTEDTGHLIAVQDEITDRLVARKAAESTPPEMGGEVDMPKAFPEIPPASDTQPRLHPTQQSIRFAQVHHPVSVSNIDPMMLTMEENTYRTNGFEREAQVSYECRQGQRDDCDMFLNDKQVYEMWQNSDMYVGPEFEKPNATGALKFVGRAAWSSIQYGRFQGQLQEQGYTIMPNARSICMANCHRGGGPSLPTLEAPSQLFDQIETSAPLPFQAVNDYILDLPPEVDVEEEVGIKREEPECILRPRKRNEKRTETILATTEWQGKPIVLKQSPYAHGAYMGAAPEMLNDEKWSCILHGLMPDVWTDTNDALDAGTNSKAIIPMLENNPVMAAYGMNQQHVELGDNEEVKPSEAMEWDAFFHPSDLAAFAKAKDDATKAAAAKGLVDRILIAHGNGFRDLGIRENVPFWGAYNRVIERPKTKMGGTLSMDWMSTFGRALEMANAPNWQKIYAELRKMERHQDPKNQATYMLVKEQLSMAKVLTIYRGVFGENAVFSVVLDLKSKKITAEGVFFVIQELNKRGILVSGVGSFTASQLTQLPSDQLLGEAEHEAPRRVRFFHFAGGLQKAANNYELGLDDTAMFNGAHLIDKPSRVRSAEHTMKNYKPKQWLIDALREYRKLHGFSLGIYVQEGDIDATAAAVLFDIANKNRDVFDYGFAWGGMQNRSASDIKPKRGTSTVGMGGQVAFWRERIWNRFSKP